MPCTTVPPSSRPRWHEAIHRGHTVCFRRSTFQLLFGLCLGLSLGLWILVFDCDTLDPPSTTVVGQVVTPLLRRRREVPAPTLVRPRYYSTELGMRHRVLVGLILSDETTEGIQRFLRINQTLSSTVDKIVFFANGTSQDVHGANYRLRAHGLTGIVPIEVKLAPELTSNPESVGHHVALRALRYFGETFVNFFDYYYFVTDRGYVNGRNLVEALKSISVDEDLLWGVPAGKACHLDSGFVVSRSLLIQTTERVSRCWSHSVLKATHGGNFMRCMEYLLPNVTCRQTVQRQVYKTSTLEALALKNWTDRVIFTGPISSSWGILQAHRLFCKARKLRIDTEIDRCRDSMLRVQPKVPEPFRHLSWPLGFPAPPKPTNRFELDRWTYFTSDTVYHQDFNTVVAPSHGVDKADMDNLLEMTRILLAKRFSPEETANLRFFSGYRRFSATRGMEYVLDYKHDLTGGLVRIEGLRSLVSAIEVIPVPFTPESKRLLYIVPITKVNMGHLRTFLDFWFNPTSYLRQNTSRSALIVLIQQDSNSTGGYYLTGQESLTCRDLVIAYNNGDQNGSVAKVGFEIVTLPAGLPMRIGLLDELGQRGLVRGSTLVLILEPDVLTNSEFLNRVFLQTIPGTQIFSPIPFVLFNSSKVKGYDMDLAMKIGNFNGHDYRTVSFYYADYIQGRRAVAGGNWDRDDGRALVDLFVKGTSVHVFRATDPHLFLSSSPSFVGIEECAEDINACSNIWVSRSQLAKVVIDSGLVQK